MTGPRTTTTRGDCHQPAPPPKMPSAMAPLQRLQRRLLPLLLIVLCVPLLLAVSPALGQLQFSAPYLVGPSTAVCKDCDPGHRNASGHRRVCGNTPAHSLDACEMCCASFFALDEKNYIGWGAGIVPVQSDGSGFYPDVVPIYHSRTGGVSWQLSGSITSKAIAAIMGPGQLIPGVTGSRAELHTMGEFTQAAGGSFISNSSVIISLDPASGDLQLRPAPWVLRLSGVPLSAGCSPHGDDLGHVGTWGLRLTRSGVIRLGPGEGYFATAIACLGGAAQTTAQKVWGAASLIGLRSADGLVWRYAGPVLEASAVPTSAIGPTENDIVQMGDGKTLLVVARTDADGSCATPVPNVSHYAEYTYVTSTTGGRTWSTPKPVKGAGCVRPRLLQLPHAGPTLLSGGRLCTERVNDIFLWSLSPGADMSTGWKKHSLSYQHNLLWRGDPTLRYNGSLTNGSDWLGTTMSTLAYTSLLPSASGGAVVMYGVRAKFDGVRGAQVGFAMPVSVSVPVVEEAAGQAGQEHVARLEEGSELTVTISSKLSGRALKTEDAHETVQFAPVPDPHTRTMRGQDLPRVRKALHAGAPPSRVPSQHVVFAEVHPWESTPSIGGWLRYNDTGHKPELRDIVSIMWPMGGPAHQPTALPWLRWGGVCAEPRWT